MMCKWKWNHGADSALVSRALCWPLCSTSKCKVKAQYRDEYDISQMTRYLKDLYLAGYGIQGKFLVRLALPSTGFRRHQENQRSNDSVRE